MPYNHGIKVNEIATTLVAPVQSTSGLQVIVGTAPVNMADDPSAAVNKAILVNSFAEAAAAVGYCTDFENYTLCQAIYASFQLSNVRPIVLINVLDPATHKTAQAEAAISVVAAKKQAVINKFGVVHSTVVVKNGDTALVNGTDYILSFDNNGNTVITLLLVTVPESLTVAYDYLNPAAVTVADVIGGYNANTGAETGIELIRTVYPRFGMAPGLLLAPGWSKNPTVAAALNAKTEGINDCFRCECVVDLDTTSCTKYSDVLTRKEAAGLSGEHEIVCWPRVGVGDYRLDFSAVWAAAIAQADGNNDDVPALRVSNILAGVTGAYLADGTEVLLDLPQANTVNGAGVVTLLNDGGWKMWGNNTAAYPSVTDPKDRWITVRRWFSWWANSFVQTYRNRVDDPTNYRLIEAVVDSENIRLNSYTPDKIAGGEVLFNEEMNPITNILAGRLTFGIKLAPYVPAEYIVANLEFDPSILQAALNGGE